MSDMSDWPPTTTSTTAVADAALERLGTTIAVATGMAATGRTIDLDGLQAAAGTLCAQVLDLPPEHGPRFRLVLIELEARLAGLEALVRHPPSPPVP